MSQQDTDTISRKIRAIIATIIKTRRKIGKIVIILRAKTRKNPGINLIPEIGITLLPAKRETKIEGRIATSHKNSLHTTCGI
jgi:hypothetical protein